MDQPNLPLDLDHTCWRTPIGDPKRNPEAYHDGGERLCPACAYVRGWQDAQKQLKLEVR